MRQSGYSFEKSIAKSVGLKYLLYLPPDYESSGEQRWPLVLFLHGKGERGDDLERVKVHGIPRLIEAGQDFPFIVVSPQCPDGMRWLNKLEDLNALLDEVIDRWRVDTRRIYLTGLSMGGFGAWALATERPERFAAVAPICGGDDPENAHRLRDVPVWAFHGAKDAIVPLSHSQNMVEALQACGGNVKFTVYPDADHDSWTETYNNPDLYAWFLSHKR